MVTRIDRTEDSLLFEEKEFQLLFENAPIGMDIVSLDTKLLQVNKAFCDIIGYSEEELLGRSVMEFTHPDDVAPNVALDQQLLDGESTSLEMRKRYLHKNGDIIHVLLKVSLGRSEKGQPSYFIGQVVDLTEIKKAELDQETHGLILDNMIEGVNVADDDGFIIFTNRAFDAMFGYEAGELIGQHVSLLNALTEAENQRLIENIIGIMRKEGIWIGEFDNRRKNGQLFTTSARISSLVIDGHKFWISVQEDITQIKQTEAEIKRRLQAEETLASISTRLVQETDFDRAVEDALEQIGKFLPAERAELMRLQPGDYSIQRNYVWRAENARPSAICPIFRPGFSTNCWPMKRFLLRMWPNYQLRQASQRRSLIGVSCSRLSCFRCARKANLLEPLAVVISRRHDREWGNIWQLLKRLPVSLPVSYIVNSSWNPSKSGWQNGLGNSSP